MIGKFAINLTLLNSIYHCWQEALVEGIDTFILVFVGTGAAMVNEISNSALTHLGICFVFGAVVAALIYATAHISGAHINPAVTLGFWATGFFPTPKVLPYIFAQCLGAIAASTLLWLTFGKVANMGATIPLNGNWFQCFVIEIVITFILMFVILGSGLDRRSPPGFAGLAIGLTVGLLAACMGPITGASMNPARSLGPALISGVWQHHWVYWVSPILGAQLAALSYRKITNGFEDIHSIDSQEKAQ